MGSKSGLKFLAWLESDSLSGWNVCDLTSARIATHAPLARLDDEHAETAKFDPLASLQRRFHRLEQRLNCDLGLDLWNAGLVGHLVDDIKLYHVSLRSGKSLICLAKGCHYRGALGRVSRRLARRRSLILGPLRARTQRFGRAHRS